jgi:hypothetical protein
MTPTAEEYFARCHCGALTARYSTALAPSRWTVRACQCSFCRVHAGLTVSDPAGQLLFAVSDPARLQHYRFASGATEFLLCRECGVYMGARIVAKSAGFGVLNVRALEVVPADLPTAIPMDYSAETPGSKRARRATRWTPLAAGSL